VYRGPECPNFHYIPIFLGDICSKHLQEYFETGGDDWDYRGGVGGEGEVFDGEDRKDGKVDAIKMVDG
jgi:hypothetical protein